MRTSMFVRRHVGTLTGITTLVAGLVPAVTLAQTRRPAHVAERVARVENGLLRHLAIAGEPVPRFTIADRMRAHRTPGVSVAVLHNSKIDWAKGYGVRRAGSSEAVDSATLFQAASISKPVAAVAALRLVDAGRLTLDADINSVLKSWKVPDTSYTATEKVTLRRLLSHSAGLTVHGFPGYAAGATIPSVVQILDGKQPANTAPVRVNVAPGSIWRYSGGGFTVMQQALSDLTGKDFPQVMRELVLEPAGMASSGYEQPLPHAKRSLAALAHRGDGAILAGEWHAYPEMAAAGLWTTPTDLLLFARAVQHSLGGEPRAILSQPMARELLTIQKGEYGLGVGLQGEGTTKRFSHGGANAGYRCYFFAFADRGDGVAIMTNSDNGSALASEIARAVSDVYGWGVMQPTTRQVVAVDAERLRSIGGSYRFVAGRDTFSVVMQVQSGALVAEFPALSAMPLRLYASEPDRFFTLEAPAEFVIERDGASAVTALRIIGAGSPLRMTRVP
ncbi:MAG: serine hydrolase domain-containing protein [Gemmatimonadaceae bacterium]